MTLNWSPLHAALGVQAGEPTSLDLVQRAVDGRVRETATLEWKQAIPDKQAGNHGRAEIAKDIGAMANSGGGLLVYGVAEDQTDDGAAEALTWVDTSEDVVRRLLQIAGNLQPPVVGIEALQLRRSDTGFDGVLVLSVPASGHAPHLVTFPDGSFKAPYRQGPQVLWMSEGQLERAYAERFRQRESSSVAMREMQADLERRVDSSQGPWLTGIALPEVPVVMPGRLQEADAHAVMKSALRAAASRWNGAPLLRSLADGSGGLRLLPGLQRWVFVTMPPAGLTEVSDWSRAEVFQNGAVTFSINVAKFSNPGPPWSDRHRVDGEAVERFCAEFLTLVDTVAGYRGVGQPYNLRIDFLRGDELPMALGATDHLRIARNDGVEGMLAQFFQPVEYTLNPRLESLEMWAGTLALDVLNQFASSHLRVLAPPD